LLADGGTGKNALRASKILKEAETNLVIYLGAAKGEGAFQCGTCGKLYTSDEDLEAHIKRRHSPNSAQAEDGMDLEPKQFGPRADPEELLKQVRLNLRLLEMNGNLRANESEAAQLPDVQGILDTTTPQTFPPGNTVGGTVDKAALRRNYSLVGSWDSWKSFQELSLQDAEGLVYQASIPVSGGKDVEFQVICDRDWKQRIFPAFPGGVIVGPSSDGHGRNWKVKAPAAPAMLKVRFTPLNGAKLDCELVMGAL